MFSFFKKSNEIKQQCEDGAICAWEFNGVLYKTKNDRDTAELNYIKFKFKGHIKALLLSKRKRYKKIYTSANVLYSSNLEEYEEDSPFTSVMYIDEVIDAIVDDWEYISFHVNALKATKESLESLKTIKQ